ncbi:LOW QUALITY PROTEIN: hypothetical protein M8C21_018683, partial [Ambrosia artemisiifolia]
GSHLTFLCVFSLAFCLPTNHRCCNHFPLQMFKNTFQSGFLSILYSLGSKPLQIWDKETVNGQVKRVHDEDIQSNVLEIVGTNIPSTYITCPADPAATLGIKLPFLVMIVKNVNKYFTFEIQVLDDKNVRRRFRASNFQAMTRVKPYICTMPLRLDEGWNQIQLNLSDLTRRAYGTNYAETLRFMPIAASEGFTSPTAFIQRKNCHQNSDFTFPCRNNEKKARHLKHGMQSVMGETFYLEKLDKFT